MNNHSVRTTMAAISLVGKSRPHTQSWVFKSAPVDPSDRAGTPPLRDWPPAVRGRAGLQPDPVPTARTSLDSHPLAIFKRINGFDLVVRALGQEQNGLRHRHRLLAERSVFHLRQR